MNWFDIIVADARLKTKDRPMSRKSEDVREAYRKLTWTEEVKAFAAKIDRIPKEIRELSDVPGAVKKKKEKTNEHPLTVNKE